MVNTYFLHINIVRVLSLCTCMLECLFRAHLLGYITCYLLILNMLYRSIVNQCIHIWKRIYLSQWVLILTLHFLRSREQILTPCSWYYRCFRMVVCSKWITCLLRSSCCQDRTNWNYSLESFALSICTNWYLLLNRGMAEFRVILFLIGVQ